MADSFSEFVVEEATLERLTATIHDPKSRQELDVLLFNVSMSALDNGAEEVFLSGSYAGSDVPEPATIALLLLASVRIIRRRA